jgi:hypothetical protein
MSPLSDYEVLRTAVIRHAHGLEWTADDVAGGGGPLLMGRTFDAPDSYESLLVTLGA